MNHTVETLRAFLDEAVRGHPLGEKAGVRLDSAGSALCVDDPISGDWAKLEMPPQEVEIFPT